MMWPDLTLPPINLWNVPGGPVWKGEPINCRMKGEYRPNGSRIATNSPAHSRIKMILNHRR